MKNLLIVLALVSAAFSLSAAETHYSVDARGLHVEGLTGSNPLIYDNDWWYDTPDKNYAKASAGKANLRGTIVTRDMWNWQHGYRYQIQDQIKDAQRSIGIARRAGLRNIPDPVAGSDRVFDPPASGRIEDTHIFRTPGSDLIVAEARRSRPSNPLVLFVCGPLNTVANAYLTDPSIADRIIVFMTDLRGYNGKDPWANYIVAARCRLINYGAHIWWPQRPEPSVMPPDRVRALPQNDMTDDLLRISEWFLSRSLKTDHPTRDDGFADGAPVFLYFDSRTWKDVKRQRVTGVFNVEDVSSGAFDLLDATELNYRAMTEDFFSTLGDPASYGPEEGARRGPVDFHGKTIYQVWMRSFTPEGTLKAAAARLPHIAELGASIVYLSPISVQSHMGGFSNPYRISDYTRIDPEYGTEDDLKAFVAEAHRLKLKVLMDIVFYHTAPDSVMMAHPEFYMHENGKIVNGRWGLPRPDFSNPGLRRYMIHNLIHWVRDDAVDGYRCDVAFGVPLDFWEEARHALDQVNPSAFLLGESDRAAEMLHAFDASYNFPYLTALQHVFHDGAPASALREEWQTARANFPVHSFLLRASDNHHQQRAIVLFGESGARAASVLNFCLDGIPFLYNGQELGDTVATDHQSHYPIRWEIDKSEGQAGSGLVRPQKQMFAFYRGLFALRASQPALTSDRLTWVENSNPDSIISFERGPILVIVNASNRSLSGTAFTSAATRQILLAGKTDSLSGNQYKLGAFGYIVAKAEDSGK